MRSNQEPDGANLPSHHYGVGTHLPATPVQTAVWT
jgi:hypothetical protein